MSDDANGPVGRVKACTECRQNKLKCDAHLDYSKPCSRCKRKGKECVITTSFKRKKRQTKAQLRDELERLREQYQILPAENRSQTTASSSVRPTSQQDSPSVIGQSPRNDGPRLFATTPNMSITPDQVLPQGRPPPPVIPHGSVDPNFQAGNPGILRPRLLQPAPLHQSPVTHHPTYTRYEGAIRASRYIDGIEISAQTISDVFSLFFNNYAPTLPDLFLQTDPDAIYHTSEYLFWSIVYTGARKYHEDPTLVDKLPTAIVALAQKNMFDPASDRLLSTILAALVFCLWPLPINSMWKDSSHAFAGAAMQLAIQSGLHHVQNEQDFARTPLKSDNASRIFRARLWSYCLIVFQCVNICHGLPFLTIPESPYHTRIDPQRSLSPTHAYKYAMHQIQTDAVTSFLRIVNMHADTTANSFDMLVDLFDDRAVQVASPADEFSRLELNCTRLLIRAYHFLSCPPEKVHISMLQIHSLAVSVFTIACDLDAQSNFAHYSTQYHWSMLVLAFACLLRIKHSEVAKQHDLSAGEEAIRRGLGFFQRRSIRAGDLDARTFGIAKMLWESKKIFKTKSGRVDPLKVHLSGRLSMSVLFDCLWWWRAEFEATPNPYTEQAERSEARTAVQDGRAQDRIIPTGSRPAAPDPRPGPGPAETAYPTPTQAMVPQADLGYIHQDLPYGDPSFTDWNWLAGLESEVLLDPMAHMEDSGMGSGYYAAGIPGL